MSKRKDVIAAAQQIMQNSPNERTRVSAARVLLAANAEDENDLHRRLTAIEQRLDSLESREDIK